MPDTSKRVLWENVLALMKREFGKENVSAFADWAKVGVGTVLRIRLQETSVGLDLVEKIAKKAGLEAWQMLVPGLDVLNPPLLADDAAQARELFARINATHEAMSGALRREGNTSPGDLDDAPKPKRKR